MSDDEDDDLIRAPRRSSTKRQVDEEEEGHASNAAGIFDDTDDDDDDDDAYKEDDAAEEDSFRYSESNMEAALTSLRSYMMPTPTPAALPWKDVTSKSMKVKDVKDLVIYLVDYASKIKWEAKCLVASGAVHIFAAQDKGVGQSMFKNNKSPHTLAHLITSVWLKDCLKLCRNKTDDATPENEDYRGIYLTQAMKFIQTAFVIKTAKQLQILADKRDLKWRQAVTDTIKVAKEMPHLKALNEAAKAADEHLINLIAGKATKPAVASTATSKSARSASVSADATSASAQASATATSATGSKRSKEDEEERKNRARLRRVQQLRSKGAVATTAASLAIPRSTSITSAVSSQTTSAAASVAAAVAAPAKSWGQPQSQPSAQQYSQRQQQHQQHVPAPSAQPDYPPRQNSGGGGAHHQQQPPPQASAQMQQQHQGYQSGQSSYGQHPSNQNHPDGRASSRQPQKNSPDWGKPLDDIDRNDPTKATNGARNGRNIVRPIWANPTRAGQPAKAHERPAMPKRQQRWANSQCNPETQNTKFKAPDAPPAPLELVGRYGPSAGSDMKTASSTPASSAAPATNAGAVDTGGSSNARGYPSIQNQARGSDSHVGGSNDRAYTGAASNNNASAAAPTNTSTGVSTTRGYETSAKKRPRDDYDQHSSSTDNNYGGQSKRYQADRSQHTYGGGYDANAHPNQPAQGAYTHHGGSNDQYNYGAQGSQQSQSQHHPPPPQQQQEDQQQQQMTNQYDQRASYGNTMHDSQGSQGGGRGDRSRGRGYNNPKQDYSSSRGGGSSAFGNPTGGLGRGRGRGHTLPAWMTQQKQQDHLGQQQQPPAPVQNQTNAYAAPPPPQPPAQSQPAQQPQYQQHQQQQHQQQHNPYGGARGSHSNNRNKNSNHRPPAFNDHASGGGDGGGRGRGRGRDKTLPAWMTQQQQNH